MTPKNYFIYTKKKFNLFILPEESTLVVALAVAVALALVSAGIRTSLLFCLDESNPSRYSPLNCEATFLRAQREITDLSSSSVSL